jgi:hypothetical protein
LKVITLYPTRLWRNGVAELIPENKGFGIDLEVSKDACLSAQNG